MLSPKRHERKRKKKRRGHQESHKLLGEAERGIGEIAHGHARPNQHDNRRACERGENSKGREDRDKQRIKPPGDARRPDGASGGQGSAIEDVEDPLPVLGRPAACVHCQFRPGFRGRFEECGPILIREIVEELDSLFGEPRAGGLLVLFGGSISVRPFPNPRSGLCDRPALGIRKTCPRVFVHAKNIGTPATG